MANNIGLTGVLRARFYCYETAAAQIGINTIYYLVTSLAGTVTDQMCAAQISTVTSPFYKNLMGTNAMFSGVGVSIMFGTGLTQQTSQYFTNADSGVGTVASNQTPLQASYVISLKTGLASRHGRGRIYPPFPPSSFATADGLMTAAGQVALQLLAAQIQTPVAVVSGANTATLTPTVRGVTGGLAAFVTVQQAVGRQAFATQRRRGQFGRLNLPPV